MQVLDHPLNVPGSNLSVIASIEIGNETIWIGTGTIQITNEASKVSKKRNY